MNKKISINQINNIIKNQKYAVIATQRLNELYTNLVAFLSSNNLKNIYFTTSNKSKKYFNLIENPNISLLIDNRKNSSEDIKNATAITVTGKASILKNDNENIKYSFLKKHPQMSNFINSDDSVFIDIQVENYVLVNSFKNISIFDFS